MLMLSTFKDSSEKHLDINYKLTLDENVVLQGDGFKDEMSIAEEMRQICEAILEEANEINETIKKISDIKKGKGGI